MPRPYSDYLKVNKDFVPVYNRYQDQKYRCWKSFYPHYTFIKILGDLVGSLEGTTAESKISGFLALTGPGKRLRRLL